MRTCRKCGSVLPNGNDVRCPGCNRRVVRGRRRGMVVTCGHCKGEGSNYYGFFHGDIICPVCKGKGKVRV